MTNQIFKLPNGRDLSYCIYGPAKGLPVLYYHGTPSSRLEPSFLAAYEIDFEGLLHKYDIKLIAVDRPGMGFSTFNPTGDFQSFAADINFLLRHLEITSSAVLCWSGGGPFALTTAHEYPHLITGVYIITGFTRSFTREVFKKMQGNKLYFGAARYVPGFTRWVLELVSRRNPTKPIPRIISRLPASDHSLMTNMERFRQVSATTLKEACRNGTAGAVYEAQLYFRNFGFDLRNIKVPVHFWWGNQDNVVQQVHAEAIEQQVQNHKIYYKPNEGHFSIYLHYFEEVLQTIANW